MKNMGRRKYGNIVLGGRAKFFTRIVHKYGAEDSIKSFIEDNDPKFNNSDFGSDQMDREFKRIINDRS